jgi:hypothetical protein
MKADMSRYTKSESARFTFVGRAESDNASDMLEKIENCLIGLNLEPDSGWAWIPEGRVFGGDLVELLTKRLADAVRRSPLLDDHMRGALASELAEAVGSIIPAFDREQFVREAASDLGGRPAETKS